MDRLQQLCYPGAVGWLGMSGCVQTSDAPKKEVSKERAALQKSVDGALVKANNKAAKGEEGLLKTYLRARFSITKNDKVHAMKF